MKDAPDASVVAWVNEHDADTVLLSMVVSELASGVEALDECKRETELRRELIGWDSSAISQKLRLTATLKKHLVCAADPSIGCVERTVTVSVPSPLLMGSPMRCAAILRLAQLPK